ncbi:hypothetical protein WA158_008373 [Blastocystis sp. Blastoise]
MIASLRNTFILSSTLLKRTFFRELLEAPYVTKETSPSLKIFGCNYQGNISDFDKALGNTCSQYEKIVKAPLTCERFGCINFTTSEQASKEKMEWSCFVVLDDPTVIEALQTNSIPNHYSVDISPYNVLHCKMQHKNKMSTLAAGIRVYPAFNRYIKKYTLPAITTSIELYYNDMRYLEYYAYLEGTEFFDSIRKNNPFILTKDI